MAISHHLDSLTLALQDSYRHTKCKGFLNVLQKPNKSKSTTALLKASRTQRLFPIGVQFAAFQSLITYYLLLSNCCEWSFLISPKHSLVTEFIFNFQNTSPPHPYTHEFSCPEIDSGAIRCPQKLPAYQCRPSHTQLLLLRYASRISTLFGEFKKE